MPVSIGKPVRVGLLGIVTMLGASLVPGGNAIAQSRIPPPLQSWQFFGVVKRAPTNRLGMWLIGMETITTDNFTDFEQFYGPLVVNACVRVDVRNGRALRISSVRHAVCAAPLRAGRARD